MEAFIKLCFICLHKDGITKGWIFTHSFLYEDDFKYMRKESNNIYKHLIWERTEVFWIIF